MSNCKYCGEPISDCSSYNNHFCSEFCYKEYNNPNCKYCGNKFNSGFGYNNHFCSEFCYNEYIKNNQCMSTHVRRCKTCNRPLFGMNSSNFCSIKCEYVFKLDQRRGLR